MSAPRSFAVGDMVRCPPDRGSPGFSAKVVQAGGEVHRNHQGQPYQWVTVQPKGGARSVWPSNRLT